MNRARRTTLLAIAALAASFGVRSQAPKKARVGVLSLGSPPPGQLEAFARELAQLGYVEGRNLEMEWRFAEGSNERLAAHARELVSMKVDALFAVSTPAALAAKHATGSIPIVIARVGDPVRSGLVKSMARPDGNITGLGSSITEVIPKLVDVLKEAMPGATHVALLWNKGNPFGPEALSRTEAAGKKTGLQVSSAPVERAEDIQTAFLSAKKAGASAMILAEDIFVTSQKSNILNLGMKHAVPVIAITREFADAGAIATYGPSASAMYRRAAQYVDRILKGAKPRDLPIEQPSLFELIVNARAARLLGLTLSPAFLARADVVIR